MQTKSLLTILLVLIPLVPSARVIRRYRGRTPQETLAQQALGEVASMEVDDVDQAGEALRQINLESHGNNLGAGRKRGRIAADSANVRELKRSKLDDPANFVTHLLQKGISYAMELTEMTMDAMEEHEGVSSERLLGYQDDLLALEATLDNALIDYVECNWNDRDIKLVTLQACAKEFLQCVAKVYRYLGKLSRDHRE